MAGANIGAKVRADVLSRDTDRLSTIVIPYSVAPLARLGGTCGVATVCGANETVKS